MNRRNSNNPFASQMFDYKDFQSTWSSGGVNKGLPTAITVVGSLNMDKIRQVLEYPKEGSHIRVNPVRTPGGHGGNQAVALSRLSRFKDQLEDVGIVQKSDFELSVSVFMVGMVGRDRNGILIKEELERNGVNIDSVLTTTKEEVETGRASVQINQYGHTIVESESGANDHLLPKHIPSFDDFKQEIDPIIVRLEIHIPTVNAVIELARDHKPPIPVLLNAAPTPPSGSPEIDYGVDFVIMNAGQACDILKIAPGSWKQVTTEQYKEVCRGISEKGVKCVVITLGNRGAVSRTWERSGRYIWEERPALRISKEQKKRVDETGASDSFIAGFSLEIMRQKKYGEVQNVSNAMERGMEAAAICITEMGSMNGAPYQDEVQHWRSKFVGVENGDLMADN